MLFGTGSGVPVATAVEQQLKGIFDGLRIADHDGVVRRVTICEIDPRRFTALRRAAGPVLARLAGDDLAVVLDEAAPIADEDGGRPGGPLDRSGGIDGSCLPDGYARRAGPRHIRVPQFAADGGRQGSSTLRRGARRPVELDTRLGGVNPGEMSGREFARFGAAIGRLLLPATIRDGLEAMSRRPLVVVHDREASRVPWEVLRIGDSHPALERGLSRRYASENLSVARWREDRPAGDRAN